MNIQSGMTIPTATATRHAGPHLGLVAAIFTVLKLASIFVVSIFVTNPSFLAPSTAANAIVAYFQAHPSQALACAFLQFGSAIPLGIFTASVVSRLRFLGARAAGVEIALFGGLMVALDSPASAFVLWVLTQSPVSHKMPCSRRRSFTCNLPSTVQASPCR
jgi:hypothetical protein